jgi:enterochelin esterase family protein
MLSVLLAAALRQSSEVVFRVTYSSPAAKEVRLAGDYTGWDKPQPMQNQSGEWTYSASVPANARLEYKFVVDGQWILDPANPNQFANGVGGSNSVFEGPEYKPTTLEQAPKTPMVRREITVDGRKVVVFSPKKSRGLPILLYGDGDNYEKIGKVQDVLQNLVEAKKARPAVIVLVQPVDRMSEYGLEWKRYATLVLDGILPAVRKLTGASSKAKDVFVGGSSMGGVISLRLAEEFPDKVAGGVHSQSGAFQWSPAKLDYSSLVTEKAFGKLAKTTRLWLDWGEYEQALTETNREAVKTLTRMGRPFGTTSTPEGHTWTAWRNRMVAGLTYILPPTTIRK